MREQRLVFGSVAERYDAHRPGYPDDLYDAILGRCGPNPSALDIGCGTGKVAVALADRGVRGMGVEPDAEMAAVARRHLQRRGWDVQICDFEACTVPSASIDVITCGQAWHWIDPGAGLAKARDVLRTDGRLNLFWNRGEWPDQELRSALDDLYERHAPDMQSSLSKQGRAPKGRLYSPQEPPAGFVDGVIEFFEHTIQYSTEEWIALLGTHSDHVMLDPAVRDSLYEAEAAVIDSFGGSMAVRYRVELWSGRRTSE